MLLVYERLILNTYYPQTIYVFDVKVLITEAIHILSKHLRRHGKSCLLRTLICFYFEKIMNTPTYFLIIKINQQNAQFVYKTVVPNSFAYY